MPNRLGDEFPKVRWRLPSRDLPDTRWRAIEVQRAIERAHQLRAEAFGRWLRCGASGLWRAARWLAGALAASLVKIAAASRPGGFSR